MGWDEDYRRRRRWLVERARHLVGDPDEAEDLAQEASLVWFHKRPSDAQPIEPWLRVVLANVLRVRRRGRLRRMLREGAVVAEREERVTDAEADLCRRERHAQVRAAVGALATPFRETLRAIYWDDRAAVDIAAAHGMPSSTVRRRHQIGIERLRDAAL
jgi:RNA polymerase sigma factor (sigma-70 family)